MKSETVNPYALIFVPEIRTSTMLSAALHLKSQYSNLMSIFIYRIENQTSAWIFQTYQSNSVFRDCLNAFVVWNFTQWWINFCAYGHLTAHVYHTGTFGVVKISIRTSVDKVLILLHIEIYTVLTGIQLLLNHRTCLHNDEMYMICELDIPHSIIGRDWVFSI